MEVVCACPSCGEEVTLDVDPTGGARQEYVEDCWVCCRPMDVRIVLDPEGQVEVSVRPLDE